MATSIYLQQDGKGQARKRVEMRQTNGLAAKATGENEVKKG